MVPRQGTARGCAFLNSIGAPRADTQFRRIMTGIHRRHFLMGKARGDFTDILIKKGILGPDQITEAKALQAQTGAKLQDAIVKLGYATQEDIMNAIAEHSGLKSVNLTDMTIPPTIIELVPESVAGSSCRSG